MRPLLYYHGYPTTWLAHFNFKNISSTFYLLFFENITFAELFCGSFLPVLAIILLLYLSTHYYIFLRAFDIFHRIISIIENSPITFVNHANFELICSIFYLSKFYYRHFRNIYSSATVYCAFFGIIVFSYLKQLTLNTYIIVNC